jgi:hypothetical protein
MRPPLLAIVFVAALGSSYLAWAAEPAAKPCSSAANRQFDFWIGTWSVFDPSGALAGENRIESINNGCALLENWSGARGLSGKSLNVYDATDRLWHQFWVDSNGTRLVLRGGFVDGKMILSTSVPESDRSTPRHRIAWSLNADGSVRQLWESSSDGGSTWTVAFDGKYIKQR